MIYPVKNTPLGQKFGEDPATYAQFGMNGHNGQDFPVNSGTPVYAPEDAVVTISANGTTDEYTGNPVSGETVVLRGTMEHWLLHNSRRVVSVGQRVTEGQLVAYSGNTGFSTGPHCHWGVRPLDPQLANGYRGFIDPLTVKEEVMFNEGDRVNWNVTLYGEDLGLHGDLVNTLSFKGALESIRSSSTFLDRARVNDGDTINYFRFFTGHDPAQVDLDYHRGHTHKSTIYNLMDRDDVKARQGIVNRDTILNYIHNNLK